MRRIWLASVGLALGVLTAGVRGQEQPWRPVGAANTPVRATPVSLGAPVASEPVSYPADTFQPDYGFTPTSFRASTPPPPPSHGVSYPPPANHTVTVNAPPPPPPPPHGAVMENPVPPSGGFFEGGPLFGCEPLGCTACANRNTFQSDHCFDEFISPLSNPFLFEDPRSLTEIRPIYMFQVTPNSNPIYNAGTLNWLGFQGRLAVTERLSFVLHKTGVIWNDPNNPTGEFQNHTGFSEIWLGPKFTFLRNESTRTLGAFGVIFQVPAGPSQVFQDTGNLSVAPYVSFAQSFGRSQYGTWNFMTTAGYSFGDERRTDYFYNSYHLDLNLFNMNTFYPLVELNWVAYTDNGGARNINFEGRDMINYGATNISGKDSLTAVIGARYKFTEAAQAGLGFEFPLISSPDLLNFRMTMDFILRY